MALLISRCGLHLTPELTKDVAGVKETSPQVQEFLGQLHLGRR